MSVLKVRWSQMEKMRWRQPSIRERVEAGNELLQSEDLGPRECEQPLACEDPRVPVVDHQFHEEVDPGECSDYAEPCGGHCVLTNQGLNRHNEVSPWYS